VVISIIGRNHKKTGTPDEDMGQPAKFEPGRHEFEFSVTFNDRDNFVWSFG